MRSQFRKTIILCYHLTKHDIVSCLLFALDVNRLASKRKGAGYTVIESFHRLLPGICGSEKCLGEDIARALYCRPSRHKATAGMPENITNQDTCFKATFFVCCGAVVKTKQCNNSIYRSNDIDKCVKTAQTITEATKSAIKTAKNSINDVSALSTAIRV